MQRTRYYIVLDIKVMVGGRGTAIQSANRCLRGQLGLISELTIPSWTEGTNISCAISGADNVMRRQFAGYF